MPESDDEFVILPRKGVRAYHNEAGGITIEPIEPGPYDVHIALSYSEAEKLASWLQSESKRGTR